MIRLLLAEGGDPNVLNDTGRSALWRACYNGHASTLRVLLEAGADPSFRDRVRFAASSHTLTMSWFMFSGHVAQFTSGVSIWLGNDIGGVAVV